MMMNKDIIIMGLVMVAAVLLLSAAVVTATTNEKVYAQFTPQDLVEFPTPTFSQRIEAAETNTEINLQAIDHLLEIISIEHVAGMAEAALVRDDTAFSYHNSRIDFGMWSIHIQLSYVTPGQVELVNVVESENATDNILNVTLVDNSAANIQEILGLMSERYASTLTENDVQAVSDRIQFHIKNMRNEISFSVPPEDVEIIGGMWVPIEELRALDAQFNPPSSLVLP
jgi:hypothetical protein